MNFSRIYFSTIFEIEKSSSRHSQTCRNPNLLRYHSTTGSSETPSAPLPLQLHNRLLFAPLPLHNRLRLCWNLNNCSAIAPQLFHNRTPTSGRVQIQAHVWLVGWLGSIAVVVGKALHNRSPTQRYCSATAPQPKLISPLPLLPYRYTPYYRSATATFSTTRLFNNQVLHVWVYSK